MEIPKKIWLLWLQGLEEAPPVVKACYTSWKERNPTWEVVLLTEENLKEFCPREIFPLLDAGNISNQAISDIIRINLLATHGGVWADATCFCVSPLDDWLKPYSANGFFAFSYAEGAPVAISSWFLAGRPDSYLVREFRRAVNEYWNNNPGIRAWNKSLAWRLAFKYTGLAAWLDARPEHWFKPLFRSQLKLHPYFWFHYIFTLMLPQNEHFREAWNTIPRFPSDVPHTLQRYGMQKEANAEIKAHIDGATSPVYKLNWRVGTISPGSALAYLMNHPPAEH